MPTRSLLAVLYATLVFWATPAAARADDAVSNSQETRMRDALRATMLQLRDAQNQLTAAQAAQAQSDKDNAELKAKVDAQQAQIKALTDQATADKAASDKSIADLTAQVADLTGQNGRLDEALKEWKNAYNQVSQLAATKEAARAQSAAQAAALQRLVDDRESKNFALYQLGGEILTRYEQFSLGEAIAAKEPFVGVSRVKLENLVQDYKNKLLDHAIVSGRPAPVPAAPSLGAKPASLTQTAPAARP